MMLFAMIVFLLSSCGLVQVCKCDKKDFENSLAYTEYTPLDYAQFKELILSDTTHYKVVNFYSPCCPGSHEKMKNEYKQLLEAVDSATTKVYFVMYDCGGLDFGKNTLNAYGFYPEQYYYLREPMDTLEVNRKNYTRPSFVWQLMLSTFDNV